jgi:hypothetical protein
MTKKERDTLVMMHASQREVSRLSEVVTKLAAEKREAQQERDEWKRRFDRLLDCCRSV